MRAAFPSRSSSTALSSNIQSHTNSRSSIAFSDLAELTDFYHLIVNSLLHPVFALNSNLPHLNPCNMFGGQTFNPATDIPDLHGKVVLVTGGKAPFSCGVYPPVNNGYR